MIVIDKLTKAFGSNKVVDEANTQFEKGKVTSIIGPNGAGKSTLLKILSRITPPTSTLNGGTIADRAGNAAVTTLPALNATGSLANDKALVVDGQTPVAGASVRLESAAANMNP